VALVQSGRGLPQGLDVDAFSNAAHGAFGAQGPVAAQSAFIGLSNPAASGLDVYCDAITWSMALASEVQFSVNNAIVGAGGAFAVRRNGSGSSAVVRLFQGNQAAFIGTNTDKDSTNVVNQGRRFAPSRPWYIAPGNQVYIFGIQQNQNLIASFEIRIY